MSKKAMNELVINVPSQIENLNLPDPSLLTFYQNLEKRILWLDCEVDNVFLEYGKYIIKWNSEDQGKSIEERVPIKLLFFSPGGNLDINNAMIDIIKLSLTPIIGLNVGVAASAGCFIFLACHKRYSFPNAIFLIHKGGGEFKGNYEEIISAIVEYQRQMKELGDFILRNTKITEEKLEENFGSEWYITTQEALEFGMIDKIITNLDEVL